MSEDLPWPEQGDSLFQESGRMSDAWIRPSDANFTVYAYSYREAAERLLKSAAAGGGHDSDLLIYPILFLYRHHVELQLKHIITEWRRHPDHSGPGYMHHGLKDLWRECGKIFEEVFPDSDDEATETVEKVILNSQKWIRDLRPFAIQSVETATSCWMRRGTSTLKTSSL